MFYIKEKVNNNAEIKIEIQEDNVFTICPRCGAEHQVDLREVLSCPQTDLYSTSVYCAKCAAARSKENEVN